MASMRSMALFHIFATMKCQFARLFRSERVHLRWRRRRNRRPGRILGRSSDVRHTRLFERCGVHPGGEGNSDRKGSRHAIAHVEQKRRLAHRNRRQTSPRFWLIPTACILPPPAPTASPISSIARTQGLCQILDKNTLAFADYSGNRQYITQGNLSKIRRPISS